MGAFSEMAMDMQDPRNPFAEDTDITTAEDTGPVAAAGDEKMLASADQAQKEGDKSAAADKKSQEAETADDENDDAAKRRAHEEAEAKRRAEWEAKQTAKKAAEKEQLDRLAAMSDDEVMAASMKRVSADTERLTRRNMKECVSEYIQTLCLEAPAFARKTMHPRKSMIHCFWYINRKAREYLQQEMKDNDIRPDDTVNGVYGGDVPDDLCYQWAVDYFNDPNAKEDEEKEEKFTPKPYAGSPSRSKGKTKKESSKKKPEEKKPVPKKSASKRPDDTGQISFGALMIPEEKAG